MAWAEPLTPGKPAGVRAAQSDDPNMPLYYFGAIALGLGVALAVANNNDNVAASASPPSTVVTTTTTTS